MSKFTSKQVNLKNIEKETAENFKTNYENSKNLIFTIDNKYNVTSANSSAAEFLGKTPAKIMGNSLFDIAPEGFLRGHRKKVRDLFKSGDPLVVENWLSVKDHQRYFQTYFEPVVDENGAVSSILSISRDITEKKQNDVYAHTMETLASAGTIDDMFYELMNNLGYLIPYFRASIALADEKEGTFEIHSYDPANPGKKQRYELSFTETALHRVYTTGKKLSRKLVPAVKTPREHDRLLKNERIKGQLFVPIKHKGAVIGTINICSDEARPFSKEQEKIVIKFADLLADPLYRIKRYLEISGLKAETEFYNDIMAHDLNNINQGLMGYYELLQMQPSLSAKQRVYLSESLALIQNSISLIDNVRTLNKLRRTELKLEKVDIFIGYNQAVEELKQQFPNENIAISHNLKPGKYLVSANDLLKNIFSNILNNAVKYDRKPEHQIELKASKRKYGKKNYIQVTISDTGPGIEDGIKERLFDRARLQESPTAAGGELGLSVVAEIIHRYSGRIRVEDRVEGDPGQGTRFIFCIPAYLKKGKE
jgi:PAS domain S-box-containing protein